MFTSGKEAVVLMWHMKLSAWWTGIRTRFRQWVPCLLPLSYGVMGFWYTLMHIAHFLFRQTACNTEYEKNKVNQVICIYIYACTPPPPEKIDLIEAPTWFGVCNTFNKGGHATLLCRGMQKVTMAFQYLQLCRMSCWSKSRCLVKKTLIICTIFVR